MVSIAAVVFGCLLQNVQICSFLRLKKSHIPASIAMVLKMIDPASIDDSNFLYEIVMLSPEDKGF